jgi:hypothetical protein
MTMDENALRNALYALADEWTALSLANQVGGYASCATKLRDALDGDLPRLDTHDICVELVSIVRGEHPAWQGDGERNADAFLTRIRHDFPAHVVKRLVDDIEAHVPDLVDLTGASARRFALAVSILRDQ